MVTIENDFLRVQVNEKGAELDRILHKKHDLDYLWDAQPVWAKKSPVLFPIVGTLKENTYYYEGKPYKLGRHGFARDRVFEITARMPDSVTLSLQDDVDSRLVYPFTFMFSVIYSLKEDELQTEYRISNTGKSKLWFSVGGHPAFRIPLEPGLPYTDYQLEFNAEENTGRWQISPDGLIEDHSNPLLDRSNILPITHELFYKDAIVLKHLHSTSVCLKAGGSAHGLQFFFEGFPFLGVWSAKNADFVCIEPWCGIADSVNATQKIEEKEGIEALEPGEVFSRTWRARFF